jgi:quinoprotein glucose dehydrogenase
VDYDIAAQPVLTTLAKDGRQRDVVIIGTKMGLVFVLDRMTGKPVFPVEERPVPASTVKGESSWPTQPFPLLPTALGIQKIDSSDSWGMDDSARSESAKESPLIRTKVFTRHPLTRIIDDTR